MDSHKYNTLKNVKRQDEKMDGVRSAWFTSPKNQEILLVYNTSAFVLKF